MITTARQRFLRVIYSRWIFGRIPLINIIIFFALMAGISRLMAQFEAAYDAKPVLTMMVSNSILNGIADTVAQTVTAIRERAVRKPGGVTKDDTLAIEIHQLDHKNPLPRYQKELIPDSSVLPPPFDFERLTRFMAWGFLMAPLQFKWFSFLNKSFPVVKGSANGTTQALKRVACDQLIFSPVGLALFFTYITVAEGGGRKAVQRKFSQVYVPALKSNYMVWPAVQMLNFRVVPLPLQLPFVSTVGIAWTTYLSLTNSAADAANAEGHSK